VINARSYVIEDNEEKLKGMIEDIEAFQSSTAEIAPNT